MSDRNKWAKCFTASDGLYSFAGGELMEMKFCFLHLKNEFLPSLPLFSSIKWMLHFWAEEIHSVPVSLMLMYHSCWQQPFLCYGWRRRTKSSHWLIESKAKIMLFIQLTFGQQMVTFSLLTIHGVSKHSSTQVVMWRKGPTDHLPLVSTTMGPVLPKCAEGGWPLCWSGGGWGVLEVWKTNASTPPFIEFVRGEKTRF